MSAHAARTVAFLPFLAFLAGAPAPLGAQTPDAPVDALVRRALEANPSIRAAEARVEAARAGVAPAAALPDPMLMAGIMNAPLGRRDADDMTSMTMRTIGIGQTLPYPGRLGLRRRIAEAEAASAEAGLEAARWAVAEEVREAYYELAFHDRALEIVRRNERLLTGFMRVAESRYGVGSGSQADVLKARVEIARLAEEAAARVEARGAALARLNAALDRPTDTPVGEAAVPERIARMAVSATPQEVRFASAELGARAAGSPLPPLAGLQETAVRRNPALRAHGALIDAQAARVELARGAHLPDFDLSLQYGQRSGRTDVVSATVSVPIPLRRGQRQAPRLREAEAELAALRAEHHARANELRAAVAGAYADLERERTQLALYLRSIIPQGRAALESATSSFAVGRVDFLTLLENQTTLYAYETAYHRSLAAFAARLATLERMTAEEIDR